MSAPGGLVNLLPESDLAQDDSPGLVAAGLSALSRGDADASDPAADVDVDAGAVTLRGRVRTLPQKTKEDRRRYRRTA